MRAQAAVPCARRSETPTRFWGCLWPSGSQISCDAAAPASQLTGCHPAAPARVREGDSIQGAYFHTNDPDRRKMRFVMRKESSHRSLIPAEPIDLTWACACPAFSPGFPSPGRRRGAPVTISVLDSRSGGFIGVHPLPVSLSVLLLFQPRPRRTLDCHGRVRRRVRQPVADVEHGQDVYPG